MKRIAGWEFQKLDGVAAEQPWVSPIGFGALPISYRNGVIVRLPGGRGRLLVHRYRSAKSRLKALEERRKVDPAVLQALREQAEAAQRGSAALEQVTQALERAFWHGVLGDLAGELRALRAMPPDHSRRGRRAFREGWVAALTAAAGTTDRYRDAQPARFDALVESAEAHHPLHYRAGPVAPAGDGDPLTCRPSEPSTAEGRASLAEIRRLLREDRP